jgi:RNase P subunit RPR2
MTSKTVTPVTITCPGCGIQDRYSSRQWWGLNNYHGISGRFCGDCYDKVAHDSRDRPRQPAEYLMMLLRLGGAR